MPGAMDALAADALVSRGIASNSGLPELKPPSSWLPVSLSALPAVCRPSTSRRGGRANQP